VYIDPRQLEESYRHCRRISRRAGSNFYAGFALLPRPKRQAMDALYAFLRYADDLADAPQDADARQEQLERLRFQLHEALQGDSSCVFDGVAGQILPALSDAVEQYKIPHDCLFDVLDGAAMDLHRNRYATFEELQTYCERVASAVGVACLHIWGFHHFATSAVLDLARQVGIALQLTNILRDIKEDAAAGRIYLPEEDFHQAGYSIGELLHGQANPGFHRLMAIMIRRAETHYRAAPAVYSQILTEGRRLFGLMVSTYHALLIKISRQPDAVLQRRIRLNPIERLRLALRWWFLPNPTLNTIINPEKQPAANSRRIP
jgi:15-cis-phytoene synthase